MSDAFMDNIGRVQELAVATFYREFLAQRKIPQELADRCGWQVGVSSTINRLLEDHNRIGSYSKRLRPGEYGVVMPFYKMDGSPIEGIFNVRRSGEADKEHPKFIFPAGKRGSFAYLQPGIPWEEVARDTTIPICFTEGIAKVVIANMMAPQVAFIAIPGVTMFNIATNPTQLPRLLESFVWINRKVVILFDNDKNPNSQINVANARNNIVDVMLSLHADVYTIDLPRDEDVAKVGIDDYLMGGGDWDQLVWVPEDNSSTPYRKLRSETIACRSTVCVINPKDGSAMSLKDWTDFNANIIVRGPAFKPDGKPDANKIKEEKATKKVWEARDRINVDGFGSFPDHEPHTIIEYDGKQWFNRFDGFPDLGSEEDPKAWEVFQRFMHRRFPQYGDYVLDWYAHRFQYPGIRNNHGLVMIDNGGTGKSLTNNILREIIGRKYFLETTMDELGSRFNAALEFAIIVSVEEAQRSDRGSYTMTDFVKRLVTATHINIEDKNVKVRYGVPFNGAMSFYSNRASPLRIDENNRKMMVLECLLHKDDAEHQADCKYLYNLSKPQLLAIRNGLMGRTVTAGQFSDNVEQTNAASLMADMGKSGTEHQMETYFDFMIETCVDRGLPGWFVTPAMIEGVIRQLTGMDLDVRQMAGHVRQEAMRRTMFMEASTTSGGVRKTVQLKGFGQGYWVCIPEKRVSWEEMSFETRSKVREVCKMVGELALKYVSE